MEIGTIIIVASILLIIGVIVFGRKPKEQNNLTLVEKQEEKEHIDIPEDEETLKRKIDSIPDDKIQTIIDRIARKRAEYEPEYETENIDLSDRDPLFEEAARLLVINQLASTSLIQRKFAIGYNRAGRLMDQLEAAGIVGHFEGSKARQILIPDEYQLEQLLNNLG